MRASLHLVLLLALALDVSGCERSAAPSQPPAAPAADAGVSGPGRPENAEAGAASDAEAAADAGADAALAATVAAACELLAKNPAAEPIPGTRKYLCQGRGPDCRRLDERGCRKQPLCSARRGSGSGPNCSPCTPDFVFWGCEPYPAGALAKQVLLKPQCLAAKGTWKGSCDCGGDALLVDQRGCVALRTLCAEAGGAWVDGSGCVKDGGTLNLSQ